MNRLPVVALLLVGLFGSVSALSANCGLNQSVAQAVPRKGPAEKPKKSAGKLVPLNPTGTVLLDKGGKRLLLKGEVVLRQGLLEMLCCPRQTKEHESVLSVDARAYVIHTGLLALGTKAGQPVRYFPKYTPPAGQRIDIFLQWSDEKGKPHRVPAQQWIRYAIHRYYGADLDTLPAGLEIPRESELRYDPKHRELSWYGPMKQSERDSLLALSEDVAFRAAIRSFYERGQPRQMDANWIFVGSGFFVDEQTGEKFYEAEQGDLICVANFPGAMIDVAAESSGSGESNLLFEAATDRIPPVGTAVTIELVPVFAKGPVAQPKTDVK
jgi:hypothetical protein